MDISFGIENKKFNYRVCAIIINNGKILAMKDGISPYFYLPGGRVKIGETAEYALLRECREELDAEPEIIRPLWLNQAFFTEDVSGIRFHEICVYFLVDISFNSHKDPIYAVTKAHSKCIRTISYFSNGLGMLSLAYSLRLLK